MANYTIEIKRREKAGTLTCKTAGVSTTCWWDLKNVKGRIQAKTYTGCSATIMDTKKYISVYIPNVEDWKGIFIHPGRGPGASKGCIVIKSVEMEKLYKAIEPKNGTNVTVNVIDLT